LHIWGSDIGEQLPHFIRDVIQKVISQNISEKIEVKAGKIVYLVEFQPIPEEESVYVYGFDISDQKALEMRLFEAYEEMQTYSEELQATNEELQTQSDALKVQSDELREAHNCLQESEKGFRTLAENSPDLIGRFDRQSQCLYANPAFIRFYYNPAIAEFYGWSEAN